MSAPSIPEGFLPEAIPIATDCEWPKEWTDGVTASGWGSTRHSATSTSLKCLILRSPKNYTDGDLWAREPLVRGSTWTAEELINIYEAYRKCMTTLFCSPVSGKEGQAFNGDLGGPWVRYSGEKVDLLGITTRSRINGIIRSNAAYSRGSSLYHVSIRVCNPGATQWILKTVQDDESRRLRRGDDGNMISLETDVDRGLRSSSTPSSNPAAPRSKDKTRISSDL